MDLMLFTCWGTYALVSPFGAKGLKCKCKICHSAASVLGWVCVGCTCPFRALGEVTYLWLMFGNSGAALKCFKCVLKPFFISGTETLLWYWVLFLVVFLPSSLLSLRNGRNSAQQNLSSSTQQECIADLGVFLKHSLQGLNANLCVSLPLLYFCILPEGFFNSRLFHPIVS